MHQSLLSPDKPLAMVVMMLQCMQMCLVSTELDDFVNGKVTSAYYLIKIIYTVIVLLHEQHSSRVPNLSQIIAHLIKSKTSYATLFIFVKNPIHHNNQSGLSNWLQNCTTAQTNLLSFFAELSTYWKGLYCQLRGYDPQVKSYYSAQRCQAIINAQVHMTRYWYNENFW